jgi:hypothetical protein
VHPLSILTEPPFGADAPLALRGSTLHSVSPIGGMSVAVKELNNLPIPGEEYPQDRKRTFKEKPQAVDKPVLLIISLPKIRHFLCSLKESVQRKSAPETPLSVRTSCFSGIAELTCFRQVRTAAILFLKTRCPDGAFQGGKHNRDFVSTLRLSNKSHTFFSGKLLFKVTKEHTIFFKFFMDISAESIIMGTTFVASPKENICRDNELYFSINKESRRL